MTTQHVRVAVNDRFEAVLRRSRYCDWPSRCQMPLLATSRKDEIGRECSGTTDWQELPKQWRSLSIENDSSPAMLKP